jgi:hypothetical protein
VGSVARPCTIGVGVERGMFRAVFEQVIGMHQYFARRGSFMGPIFLGSEPLPERNLMWKTFGTLMALHMYYFKQGPADISPFLVLGIEGGRNAMNLSADYIAHLDPEIASAMRPWLSLTHRDAMPTSLDHPLSSFLMIFMDMQVLFCF